MQQSETYRERAQLARLKARETEAPELCVAFEILATGYDALAKNAERLGWDASTTESNVRLKPLLHGEPANFEEPFHDSAVRRVS